MKRLKLRSNRSEKEINFFSIVSNQEILKEEYDAPSLSIVNKDVGSTPEKKFVEISNSSVLKWGGRGHYISVDPAYAQN